MVFPALRQAVKEWINKDEPAVQTLQIEQKSAGGLSFDAVNVGWYARNGYPGIYSIMSGGMPAWSGEAVSVETALNHSVVWACNRIISESIGFIPCVMFQRDGVYKNPATKHPMYSALVNAPNDEITAQGFTEMLTGHCVLQGNGFARIYRRSGTGVAYELEMLQPTCVIPDREVDGQKRLVYIVKMGQEASKTYTVQRGKPHDILHLRGLGWDGLRGFSVITMARQSIGTATSAERNVARFYANGGRVPYVLNMPRPFKLDTDYDKFRTDWERVYQEPHRTPILENGTTYQQIGLNSKDSQLLETRLFNIHEICRWFLVSPHLVGDLSRATFSNIEELALEFVKMTLNTWLTRWEQELWRCVLTPDEKGQDYFWHHDIKALLRGSFAARMAGYASALQNGHLSINEVRDDEDRNPVEGGDKHRVQLNMQEITTAGDDPATSEPLPVEDNQGGKQHWLYAITKQGVRNARENGN